MTPTIANPVLKTDIVIQLSDDFPVTLNKNDFSVNATDVNDETYVRYLKVNEVDDEAKTITAKFGGAESSTFDIKIRHSEIGMIKSDALSLDVNTYVTSVSPNTGSIYGGTLLTIGGGVFGDLITDNPVQLSFNGGLGSINCYVETTGADEVTCRVDSNGISQANYEACEVVLFLKASEKSTCEGTTCDYLFTSVLPTISTATQVFDNDL
jgi:hypothetical protein